MVTPKQSVADKLSERYDIDAQTAERLIRYNGAVRGQLNGLYSFALMADKVQTKDGVAANVTEVVKEAVGVVPVVGNALGFLGFVANRTARAFEEKSALQEAANVRKMNQSGDPAEWCEYTKELAELLTEQRLGKIMKMDDAAVRKLAEEDAAKIAKEMTSDRAKGIYNPDSIPELVDAFRGRVPSASLKPEAAEQVAGRGHGSEIAAR